MLTGFPPHFKHRNNQDELYTAITSVRVLSNFQEEIQPVPELESDPSANSILLDLIQISVIPLSHSRLKTGSAEKRERQRSGTIRFSTT
jgi:hypothetical protein